MQISWEHVRNWFAETWGVVRDAVNQTLARHPWPVIIAAALGPTIVGVIFLGIRT